MKIGDYVTYDKNLCIIETKTTVESSQGSDVRYGLRYIFLPIDGFHLKINSVGSGVSAQFLCPISTIVAEGMIKMMQEIQERYVALENDKYKVIADMIELCSANKNK